MAQKKFWTTERLVIVFALVIVVGIVWALYLTYGLTKVEALNFLGFGCVLYTIIRTTMDLAKCYTDGEISDTGMVAILIALIFVVIYTVYLYCDNIFFV